MESELENIEIRINVIKNNQVVPITSREDQLNAEMNPVAKEQKDLDT